MDLHYLLKGAVIGLSIAAPVGPIGIFCIRRTLTYGRLAGFTSGLGAATADTTYGFIAAFGLTSISSLLLAHAFWIRLFGGLFLVYLGVKTVLSKAAPESTQTLASKALISGYVTTLMLTITNPLTIISFLGIFAGLGVGAKTRSYIEAGLLVVGVFVGSSSWFLILSSVTGLIHHKLTPKTMILINRGAGILILIFSAFIFLGMKN